MDDLEIDGVIVYKTSKGIKFAFEFFDGASKKPRYVERLVFIGGLPTIETLELWYVGHPSAALFVMEELNSIARDRQKYCPVTSERVAELLRESEKFEPLNYPDFLSEN